MATDGSLKFDTKIDESGFKKGMSGLQKTGSAAVKGIVTATKVASAAVLGIGIASIKVGSDFEAGMSQVASTMGITVDEINNGSESFDMLSDAAKEMGKTTMFSATESAEALNYLALAGYDAEDSVAMLPKVLNLASAGGLDLAYASDMVTDSMSALGLNIDQADEYIDQMAKTSQKSNTDVSQLGEAILTVGANAKDLKGGTAELNTAIGLLGNVGLKGAESGTKLRNVIRSISTPTDKAKDALNQLGVETYDASGELKGMDEVMGDLNKSMEGMTTQEKKEMISQIFNPADMGAALTLLAATSNNVDDLAMAMEELGVPVDKIDVSMEELAGSMADFESESDFAKYAMEEFGFTAEESEIAYGLLKDTLEDGTAWDELEEQIRDSEGAAQDMSDTLNDNLQGDIERLKSALEFVGVSLYENMQNPLREVTQGLNEYISEIGDAVAESDSFGEAMEVVAEILGDMLVEAIQGMAEAIPQVLEMAQLFITSFLEGIQQNKGDLINAALDIVESILNLFAEVLPAFLETGIQLINQLIFGVVERLPDFIEKIQGMVESIFLIIQENLPLLIKSGITLVTSIILGLVEALPMLMEMGLELILTIVESIIENLPLLIESSVMILETIIENIVEHLPKMLELALEIITTIAEGITENIPLLIDSAFAIIEMLSSFIIENLPMILDAALEIILAVIEGLVSNVAQLVEGAVQIIESISSFLIDNLPVIIDAALQIILAIMEGLVNNLDIIIAATFDIIDALITAIIQMLPEILSMGLEIIFALADGVLNNMPAIVGAITQIIFELIGTILGMLPQLLSMGIQLVGELAGGVLSAVGTATSAMKSIVLSVISAAGSALSGIVGVGKDLVRGLWNGINDMTGWVIGKIQGFGDSVLGGIKSFFGISSPSKLFRDQVGEELVFGIGVGFEGKLPSVQRDLERDLDKFSDKMTAAVDIETNRTASRVTGLDRGRSVNKTENHTDNSDQRIIIEGNEFVIREEADIDKVAKELLRLKNRRKR